MKRAHKPSAKTLARAVHLTRLYAGSTGTTSIRVQQRLYDRMRAASLAVARATGVEDAPHQIAEEARRLGPLTPIPGKDY